MIAAPFLVSAPGKTIIFGEHAAVYGKVSPYSTVVRQRRRENGSGSNMYFIASYCCRDLVTNLYACLSAPFRPDRYSYT